MRTKRPTKRIHIHTYIHTSMNDINTSLMPKQITFMFVLPIGGQWMLRHTFPYTDDKIVRDFVRGYTKMSKGTIAAVRIEKHIYGGAR